MQMRTAKLLIAGVAVVVLMKCHQTLFTAPPGSSLRAFANPTSIPASGGVAVITAIVYDGTGQPVPDGTTVQFFTNLGRVDPTARTDDGTARANLVADGRSGKASVTVLIAGGSVPGPAPSPSATATTGATPTPTTTSSPAAGTVSQVVDVQIGATLPRRVLLSADPRNIPRAGPRFSTLTATVIDVDGNPVANTPVVFRLGEPGDPEFSESLESGGQPVYTNNNGQAVDRVFTSHPRDGGQKNIRVEAEAVTAAGVLSDPIFVGVNY
jgi:hypothetical protein